MKNVANSFIGGFFRKLGNFCALLFILLIIGYFLSYSNIDITKFLRPIFMTVKADEFVGRYVDVWKYNNIQLSYQGNSDTFNIGFKNNPAGLNTKFFETNINVPKGSYFVYFKLYHNFRVDTLENVFLDYGTTTIHGNVADTSKQLFTITIFDDGGWSNCENVHSTNQTYISGRLDNDQIYNYGYDTFKCPVSSNANTISKLSATYFATVYDDYYTIGFNSNFQFLTSSGNDFVSAQNATTQAVNELNDTQKETNDILKDDDTSEAENEASDFFSSFETNTHGLTGIVTAPLNAIQSLTSSSCSPLNLTLPFVNKNLTLPCMRPIYLQHFGSFMNLYDIITLGIVSYWVAVRIFGLVKDFKNPYHDEIEVLDL